MSLRFRRNIVIPAWLLLFSLVVTFVPALPFWPFVMMLVGGLTVPIVAYAVLKDAPIRSRPSDTGHSIQSE